MKKTKLLMPILGVTAITGAIIPTVVACKSESEGLSVALDDVKVIETEELVGYTASSKTKLPRAIPGKDYLATIKWTEYDSDGKPLPAGWSCVDSVRAYNSDGDITIYPVIRGYNSVVVMIPGQAVTKGMHIELTVQIDENDKSFNLDQVALAGDESDGVIKINNDGHAEWTKGLCSNKLVDLTDQDNFIGLSIPLSNFGKCYESEKDTRKIKTLVLYAESSGANLENPRRVEPTFYGEAILGADVLDVSYEYVDSTYALFIDLPKETLVSKLQGNLTISINYSLNFAMNLNGGRFCCYDYAEIK